MEIEVTASGIKGNFIQLPSNLSIQCGFETFDCEYSGNQFKLRKNLASRFVNTKLFKKLELKLNNILIFKENKQGVFTIIKKEHSN
jgi:hypothetical protein